MLEISRKKNSNSLESSHKATDNHVYSPREQGVVFDFTKTRQKKSILLDSIILEIALRTVKRFNEMENLYQTDNIKLEEWIESCILAQANLYLERLEIQDLIKQSN